MLHQKYTWISNCKSELVIYLSKNPQKYYMISTATKSGLTIKIVAHLTIGIKFNVSFLSNNSF